MFTPLKVVSDYNILKSIIKIDNLILFLKKHNITSCALVDENLYGSMEFFNKCKKNNINPIIGLDIIIDNKHVYLYAKNKNGYKKLIKLNTLKQKRELEFNDLDLENIKVIVPYNSIELFGEFKDAYLGYETVDEEKRVSKITKNIIFVNEIKAYDEKDMIYLDYLTLIKEGKSINELQKIHKFNYFPVGKLTNEDIKRTNEFISDIELDLTDDKRYIPSFENPLNDS